ncbi:hypothetical protein ACFQYP_07780 [Nonomuraea antimicrobica]
MEHGGDPAARTRPSKLDTPNSTSNSAPGRGRSSVSSPSEWVSTMPGSSSAPLRSTASAGTAPGRAGPT